MASLAIGANANKAVEAEADEQVAEEYRVVFGVAAASG